MDLTPKGMKTEAGERRIRETLDARNDVDYKCYRMIVRMLKDKTIPPKYKREAEDIINDRNLKNDQFLDALAGK